MIPYDYHNTIILFEEGIQLFAGLLRYVAFARMEIRPWIWGVLGLLYLSALLPNQGLALCLLGFISFQALKEYFSIIPMRHMERPFVLLSYLSIPLQLLCVAFWNYGLALAFTPLYILLLSLLGLRQYGRTPQMLNSILKIGWGVFTLVYCLSYFGLLMAWAAQTGSATDGTGLVLFFLLIVHFQGIMLFLLNRWHVNDWLRPLFDHGVAGIAGFISILATGIIASSLGFYFTFLTLQEALIAGFVIGTAAYIGSATVHTVQQALYISDEEAMTPGMGGILSFVYPLVYAAPLFFFLLMAYH